MKAFVAVTDKDWFDFLQRRQDFDEVNFWQPSGNRIFSTLQPGEPFLFKLHYPDNFIVGGGFFIYAKVLPASFAWDAFGEKNGAGTFEEMRARIEKYRRVPTSLRANYAIGCIILGQPFFLDRQNWILVPPNFAKNIVQGKTYDLFSGIGKELWGQVQSVLRVKRGDAIYIGEGDRPVYGEPVLVRPRLGQGSFRLIVTDTYQRRCAVTGEKALPVIEAAHIKPVKEGGLHQISNGLLLRSDVHTLFDRGYVTVTQDLQFRVSHRLRADFNNGEQYYKFNGQKIWAPPRNEERPSRELLEWHADMVFLR